MATTRVGFGGPSAAYQGFQAKAAQIIVLSATELIGTYVTASELVGTYVHEDALTGTYVRSSALTGTVQ